MKQLVQLWTLTSDTAINCAIQGSVCPMEERKNVGNGVGWREVKADIHHRVSNSPEPHPIFTGVSPARFRRPYRNVEVQLGASYTIHLPPPQFPSLNHSRTPASTDVACIISSTPSTSTQQDIRLSSAIPEFRKNRHIIAR